MIGYDCLPLKEKMKRKCENCQYFKYAESNVYGRCQNDTEGPALKGIPRVPWAMACEFFQDRKILDKNNFNEENEMEQDQDFT